MKKSIIFSLTAIALIAFAFTSCKKDSDVVTEITGLTIKPATLILSPGEGLRLTVATEPANAVVTITWTSSNPEVATVAENGYVTAVDFGEATITAKSGDYSATCAVSVKSAYERLGFTGACILNYDTTYTDKVDTIESMDGDKYLCKKVLCQVEVFTEGFYWNNDGELTGQETGGILEFEAPFYWAPGWLNGAETGTRFVLGDWGISDDTTKYPDSTAQVGRPASIDEANYIHHINEFIHDYYIEEDETKAGQDLKNASQYISGATLTIYEYHTEEEGYPGTGYFSSHIPDLYFGNGWLEFGNSYKISKYMLSVDAYQLQAKELKFDTDTTTYEIYRYGGHFQENDSDIVLVDNEVHYGESYIYEHNVPANTVRKSNNKQARLIEIPVMTDQQRARFKEQIERAKSIKKVRK